MENEKIYFNFHLEQRIIHHLMMKSSFVSDPGLLYGKMGISLFFFWYSRIKNNAVYSDFAEDLLEEIWTKIDNHTPNNFSSGLTGIGWGIEYLLQNDFISGDGNEICADIDCNLMKRNVKKECMEMDPGELNGFLHYILIRLYGSWKRQTDWAFEDTYRKDLYEVFFLLSEQKNISEENKQLAKDYCLFFFQQKEFTYVADLNTFIQEKEIMEKNLFFHPFGLKIGLAGWLYNKIKQKLG